MQILVKRSGTMKFIPVIALTHAFLLLGQYQPSETCSCFPTHPQNKLCGNSFLLVGKILSRRQEGDIGGTGSFTYTARVVIPIRNSPKNGEMFTFSTPGSGASCGVSYTIGSTALLTGTGRIIRICNQLFRRTLPQLSYIFSRRKTSSYFRNCECKIDDGGATVPPDPTKSCRPPPDKNVQSCYDDQGLCVKVGRGQRARCVWKNVKGCESEATGPPR